MAIPSCATRVLPLSGVIGVVLTFGVGCGETILEPVGSEPDSLVGEGGAGATGGSGTGGIDFTECVLHPNETGWVESQNNFCRAQGPWYAYNDCNDSPDDCTRNQIPVEGEFPNVDGKMCTSGTTAAPANAAEKAIKWGAGIGLFFNQDAETEAQLPLEGLGLDIVGIRFTLDSNVGILVNFPMESTEDTAHMVEEPFETGTHEVYFTNTVSPPWDPTPVPLKPGQIVSVQFQVPTEIGVSIDFEYCIEDLTLLL